MKIRAWILPLLALWTCGCVATQQDVLDLEGQTNELKNQITDLKKTVSNLEANQADLSAQMSQLNDGLKTFTATIQDSQDRMTKLSAKLDDMGAQVTTKVESIGSTLSSQEKERSQQQKETLAKQEAAILNQVSPTSLFDAANERLSVRSYDLAAKGFSTYLKQFPDGALADIALYKLGQSYYGLRQWEDSGKQFALMLEKYPKNDLTPSARLMYALCLIHLRRNIKEAKQYLESIPHDYPKSPEAHSAQLELKKLNKPAGK